MARHPSQQPGGSAPAAPDAGAGLGAARPAEGPSVETWSERDQRIVVTHPAAGYLYDLILRAKIEGLPDEVYAVLTDPQSHTIFRGIKETLSRSTLEDDGRGRRKLRVAHRAVNRFLWLSVTFDTELFVWEDDRERTIRFTNARQDGFMRQFDGTWRVQPFTQATLDGIYRAGPQQQKQQQQQHGWLSPAGALSALQQRVHRGAGGCSASLVTLEQALAPRARPPGPVAHLVRGLCARVLHTLMADLRAEVQRRHALPAGGTAGDASGGAGGKRQRQQQQKSPPSLPVASLTCSAAPGVARFGLGGGGGGAEGGGPAGGLLDAAAPLSITIRL